MLEEDLVSHSCFQQGLHWLDGVLPVELRARRFLRPLRHAIALLLLPRLAIPHSHFLASGVAPQLYVQTLILAAATRVRRHRVAA